MNKVSQSEQKKIVAYEAIDRLIEKGFIFSGVKIGLGTGSTAVHAVYRLAEHIKSGKLTNVKAVATSFQTVIACEETGIPVYTLNSKEINAELDVSIDGADEIDPNNNLIKGGGAAHALEKIVEYNSKKLVIIADSTKLVPTLGTKFPLPIEVIAESRLPVQRAMEKMGATCTIRECAGKAGPIISDNGNQILDCVWQNPVNPIEMEDKINAITGVVENGFFTKNKPLVMIAYDDGSVKELEV